MARILFFVGLPILILAVAALLPGEEQPPKDAAAPKDKPQDRRQFLGDFFDTTVLIARAKEEGVDREERFMKAVQLMELKLLSHMVTEPHREELRRQFQVSTKELQAYYENHRNEYIVEPHFTAHQLVVYVKGNPAFSEKGWSDAVARQRAATAMANLRAGKKWNEVVEMYSDEVTTGRKGGLIREGQFGYFPTEVEHAVKTQVIGKPGRVIRSVFGYHVVEVLARQIVAAPLPFEEVADMLRERISKQRAEASGRAFMTPIHKEMNLEVTEAGRRKGALLDRTVVLDEELLATIGGKPIYESDFRWFLKDALIPSQRMSAYSRAGDRQGMLQSFFDMLVLAAKARKEGYDQNPVFMRKRTFMKHRLYVEFMQAKDKSGPFNQCTAPTKKPTPL